MSDETRLPGTGATLPEGEEAPPPGVRVMAIARWALVVLMAVAAASAWAHLADRSHVVRSANAYRCPMHPSMVRARAGACAVCGMDLVLVERSTPPDGRERLAAGGSAVPGLVPIEIDGERTQLMGMRTAKATRQPFAAQLRTSGFVAADESSVAIVSMRFSGWIERVLVAQTGAWVKKGQVLATVQGPELVSAQESYLATIDRARRQDSPAVRRGPDNERRALQRLGMAEEDIEAVVKRGQPFDAVPIRAPISGYIAKRSAVPGLSPQPGTELFQIADLSTVLVVADVNERDVGCVRVGGRARISLASYRGESFTGTVHFIYPALNPDSRTLQIRIQLQNPELKLRPGMSGDVIVEAPPVDALTVPSESVVDTGELQYVFVERARGRFEPRPVRIGATSQGRVQILEGLEEHERVVTTANFFVDAESRLRAAAGTITAPPSHDEVAPQALRSAPGQR